MNEELQTLQQAWLDAKAKEDEAKKARLLVENLILEKIGWTEGDPEFKSWKDQIKITFGRKEEYDNDELFKLFQPQDWSAPKRQPLSPHPNGQPWQRQPRRRPQPKQPRPRQWSAQRPTYPRNNQDRCPP